MSFKYRIVLILVLVLRCTSLNAQNLKGKFYFYLGHNWSKYTTSNIQVKNPGEYDFTLYDVKGEDIPTDRASVYFSLGASYNIRLGYYVTDKLSLSLGQDHMKYRTTIGQSVKINGFIKESASSEYQGVYSEGDQVTIDRDFIYIEHSDGLNYVSLEAEYQLFRKSFWKDKLHADILTGGGVGLMIPRTESAVFGYQENHNFHLSGYGANIHFTPRLYYKNLFFIQPSIKAGFINMPDVLLGLDASTTQRAAQKFLFFEWKLVYGGVFGLPKKR